MNASAPLNIKGMRAHDENANVSELQPAPVASFVQNTGSDAEGKVGGERVGRLLNTQTIRGTGELVHGLALQFDP